MKNLTIILCVTFAAMSLGLTPTEKNVVIHAQEYLQKAKDDAHQQQALWEEADRTARSAESTVNQQFTQIGTLGKQIETSHNNEVELGKYNTYAKPIVEQVNSYWGIGAFVYGFKVLARHLFILIAVLIGVALLVFAVSFIFPELAAFLRTAGTVVAAIIRRIGGYFRKK